MDAIHAGNPTFTVDAKKLDEDQVRATFSDGRIELKELSIREKAAMELISKVCTSGRLIDIGCYVGKFLRYMTNVHPKLDVTGIDSYEDNVRIARLLYPNWKDRFSNGSVYSLKFGSESFDCVCFMEVLEHIDRPIDAIREINRIIKPGGYLVLSTPNAASLRHVRKSIILGIINPIKTWLKRRHVIPTEIFFESVDWNRHIIEYLPTSLSTLLHINGFDIVEHRFVPSSMTYRILDYILPGMSAGQIVLAKKLKSSPTTFV